MNFGFSRAREAPQPGAGARVSPEDFKTSNISRAVLTDCLQHPATIFPVAGGVAVGAIGVATVWPAAVAVAFGMAFLGGSAFVWNYVINGERRGAAKADELRALRRRQYVDEFNAFASKCKQQGFLEGYEKASQIAEIYSHLLDYLAAHPKAANVEQFRFLAEDTCKQGFATLTLALDLETALRSVDRTKIARDLAAGQQAAARTPADDTRAKTLARSIADTQRRLALLDEKQGHLEELIAQAAEIESALQATQLELVELGQEDPTEFLTKDGGAAARLRATVQAAHTVEARMRGEDPERAAKEKMYSQVADATDTSNQSLPSSVVAARNAESEQTHPGSVAIDKE